MSVRFCLREVVAYGSLKLYSFSREIVCLLGGVRLWEVSVSGGSTFWPTLAAAKVVLLSTGFYAVLDCRIGELLRRTGFHELVICGVLVVIKRSVI